MHWHVKTRWLEQEASVLLPRLLPLANAHDRNGVKAGTLKHRLEQNVRTQASGLFRLERELESISLSRIAPTRKSDGTRTFSFFFRTTVMDSGTRKRGDALSRCPGIGRSRICGTGRICRAGKTLVIEGQHRAIGRKRIRHTRRGNIFGDMPYKASGRRRLQHAADRAPCRARRIR